MTLPSPSFSARLAALALLAPSVAPAFAQCQEAVLLDPSPAIEDHLGTSVALTTDLAIAGAPQFGAGAGEAQVFRRVGETWVFEDTLVASDGTTGDEFGWDVDLDGDWAIVGAPDKGTGGAVYFFERVPVGGGFEWVERTSVVAVGSARRFGHAVAIDGALAVVGDPEAETALFGSGGGNAFVYRRTGSSWVAEDVLAPTVPAANMRIGYAVDVEGEAALVGAPGPSNSSGIVYYWGGASGAGAWALIDFVEAPTAATDGEFGNAVALAGTSLLSGLPTVAIGAWRQSVAPFVSASGAVHLYRITVPTFPEPPELEPHSVVIGSVAESFAEFGGSIAFADASFGPFFRNRLAIGAAEISNGGGGVFLFESSSTSYQFVDVISSPGSTNFGIDVALAAGRVAAGDWLASAPLQYQGAARIYTFSSEPCALAADTTHVGLAAGGTVEFTVEAGAGHADDVYWILGSASGAVPGLDLGGVHLPLNFDAYTQFTISNANGASLPGTFGTLDGGGAAFAQFIVPAGSNPNLAGIELYHAALVFDAVTGAVELATNPVALKLV